MFSFIKEHKSGFCTFYNLRYSYYTNFNEKQRVPVNSVIEVFISKQEAITVPVYDHLSLEKISSLDFIIFNINGLLLLFALDQKVHDQNKMSNI